MRTSSAIELRWNHLQGGGFASFFKNGPQVISQVTTAESPPEPATAGVRISEGGPTNPNGCPLPGPTGPCFPGGYTNPLNYPADGGNGLGFSTSKAALGFPAGGLGPDNRILFCYLGDSWKIKSNFTLTYGLRYERDTLGRTDSQYARRFLGLSACSRDWVNAVTQPNKNFGPDLGFARDPMKNGKTSIRGGISSFWENAIWNNVLFDGPFREANEGAVAWFPSPCAAAGSTVDPSSLTTGPIHAECGSLRHLVRWLPIDRQRCTS